MRKYTNNHKKLLKEIKERNDFIVGITNERIENPDGVVPLDFMLESRFNELKKQAIKIEAEINYIESDDIPEEERIRYTEHIDNLVARLTIIKGAMNENRKFSELVVKLGRANRDFEVVD